MTGAAITAGILALPETAGSALYGLVDVLGSAGTMWQELSGEPAGPQLIRPMIVSQDRQLFHCGNNIPVSPEARFSDRQSFDFIILPELWLAPDDDLAGRYPDALEWIHDNYRRGSSIYSACSGAILLARTGLLRGRKATSHWAYQDLFRRSFPDIDFRPEPNLVFADEGGRIVTAGGTTSWHDLALHIISRHCGTGEALRIAKIYLLKWHSEGQLPYANLARRQDHADSAVRSTEDWLSRHFREQHCISAAVQRSSLSERSLKRRFKMATGSSMIDYIQNLRIEAAKRQLEMSRIPIEEIAVEVGYENSSFFRRIFKRTTGLLPAEYRRMFETIDGALSVPTTSEADNAAMGR